MEIDTEIDIVEISQEEEQVINIINTEVELEFKKEKSKN